MILENVCKQSLYTLLKISGLFANLPENREPARSMKNMTEIFEKNFLIKFIQSEKFVDKNYKHFENLLLLSFKTFLKLTDYIQTFQISGTYQIHQKPTSTLSRKSLRQF